MVLESITSQLHPGKQAGVFFIAFLACSMSTILGQINFIHDSEPAWMCLLIGLITGLIAFLIFNYGYKEMTKSTVLSSSVLSGLIAAHVSVFHVTGKFIGVMQYLLFLFVFYWDFSEGSLLNASPEHNHVHVDYKHPRKIE